MKEIAQQTLLKIDKLPFFVGILNQDRKPDVPKFLPFHLYVDKRLAIPRLVRTKALEAALVSAYGFGSMLSTPLGESSLASDRMQEFLTVLSEKAQGCFKGKNFVEVGAGNGALLNAVRRQGANVIGFEIGPQAERAKEKFGLKIIQGELSQESLSIKVDCIYSYGCLEHIFEPHTFIDIAKDLLVQGGLFFHRVPNASTLFKSGDIQGLCHEHVNYFTPENAIRLMMARGFVNCGAQPSRAGNELDIWGYANSNAPLYWPGDIISNVESESVLLTDYADLIDNHIKYQVERLKCRVAALAGGKLGFYAGGHILAAIAGVEEHCRFFDGDENKWGGSWLSCLSPIESPTNLITNPPVTLVICSEHYFVPIYDYLRKTLKVPESIEIVALSAI